MRPKIERNVRMYRGHERGVSLSEIARIEGVTVTRAYQIITATDYQLTRKNPDYTYEVYRQEYGKE